VRDFGWVDRSSGVVTALDERTKFGYSRESAESCRHLLLVVDDDMGSSEMGVEL
jgi:hypothetical protein